VGSNNLGISVIIHTLNEEENIASAIKSVKWTDEIIVCDMHSDDKTVEVVSSLGAKIITHERVDFVEPARNFAISKASYDWILILDADEEIPEKLADKLKSIVADKNFIEATVDIPRKNIIFGKWMKASFWWPDFQPRFFKKGAVTWKNEIHSKPEVRGIKLILPEDEDLAIIHHHYQSVGQYIERMNRYTSIQAKELKTAGYEFNWRDVIEKPLGEFLGRFFANNGYSDGLHGLALSLLQAFSFLVMYLKIWELEKFKESDISLEQISRETKKSGKEIKYWQNYSALSRNPLKRLSQKVMNKFR
jgi:glycosyltransferase involved in cell wall biosynthesis